MWYLNFKDNFQLFCVVLGTKWNYRDKLIRFVGAKYSKQIQTDGILIKWLRGWQCDKDKVEKKYKNKYDQFDFNEPENNCNAREGHQLDRKSRFPLMTSQMIVGFWPTQFRYVAPRVIIPTLQLYHHQSNHISFINTNNRSKKRRGETLKWNHFLDQINWLAMTREIGYDSEAVSSWCASCHEVVLKYCRLICNCLLFFSPSFVWRRTTTINRSRATKRQRATRIYCAT